MEFLRVICAKVGFKEATLIFGSILKTKTPKFPTSHFMSPQDFCHSHLHMDELPSG